MASTRWLLFATFLVSALALTPRQKATLEPYSKHCRDAIGVTPEDIKVSLNGEDRTEVPKLKAMALCVLKEIELINDDGEINVEQFKKLAKEVAASDEEAESVVAMCALQKDTPEETAFDIIRCLHEKWPQFSPVE